MRELAPDSLSMMAGSYTEAMNTLIRREVAVSLSEVRQQVRQDIAQAEAEPDIMAKIKPNR